MTLEEKFNIVISNYFPEDCDIDTTVLEAYSKGFKRGVEKAKTSYKRQSGRWIPVLVPTGVSAFGIDEQTVQMLKCSQCEREVDVSEGNFAFCPHCGAEMEGNP